MNSTRKSCVRAATIDAVWRVCATLQEWQLQQRKLSVQKKKLKTFNDVFRWAVVTTALISFMKGFSQFFQYIENYAMP